MVRNAEATARAAEATFRNRQGMCLQQCRTWADIPARYPTAATAWSNVNVRHLNRDVPRGAMAYWVGGSRGAGHIGVGLGGHGSPIRSTDAGGSGIVATRDLAWFDRNWPSLRYVGWAWDVNEVTIPHQEEDEMNDADWVLMKKMIEQEVRQGIGEAIPALVNAVWAKELEVKKPDDTKVKKSVAALQKETWQRVAKA